MIDIKISIELVKIESSVSTNVGPQTNHLEFGVTFEQTKAINKSHNLLYRLYLY